MTEYVKTSGTTGQMKITDLGSVVEFWFRAGYSNDHWDPLQFNVTANGSTSATINVDYNTGRPWVKVATRTVTSSQTVTFRLLTKTGTSGMGGPTTFSVSLSRGGVPASPTAVMFSEITFTSVLTRFFSGADNGYPIDAHQIARNTVNSVSGATIIFSSGTTRWTTLVPGTVYYFWARSHNAKGWGPWSPVRSTRTLAGARIKVGSVWKLAVPYVKTGGVWKMAKPWARRAGTWKEGQ